MSSAKRRAHLYRADSRTDSEIGDGQVITGREFPAVEESVEHLERFLHSS